MNDRGLEHPDVTRAKRDGWPRGSEPKAAHFCSECGDPIFIGDYALHVTGWGWLCEDCVHDKTVEVEA